MMGISSSPQGFPGLQNLPDRSQMIDLCFDAFILIIKKKGVVQNASEPSSTVFQVLIIHVWTALAFMVWECNFLRGMDA